MKLATRLRIMSPSRRPPTGDECNRRAFSGAFISHSRIKLAGEEGFEPSLHGPEPCVLPLDYSPVPDVTESKSSPLPGVLNGILPLNLPLPSPWEGPQKAAEIGQQIQSLLSNPRLCLDPLCNQSLTQLVLKCQPRHPWPAGILLASPMAILKAHSNDPKRLAELGIFPDASPPERQVYDRVTDNANEPPSLHAPLTLPEYVVEVMP